VGIPKKLRNLGGGELRGEKKKGLRPGSGEAPGGEENNNKKGTRAPEIHGLKTGGVLEKRCNHTKDKMRLWW